MSAPRFPASIILAVPPSRSVRRSPIQPYDRDATWSKVQGREGGPDVEGK